VNDTVDLVAALRASVEAAKKRRTKAEADAIGAEVCDLCGRIVRDPAPHADWHARTDS
jgi:hypothetical protein